MTQLPAFKDRVTNNPYDYEAWIGVFNEIEIHDSNGLSNDQIQEAKSLFSKFLSSFPLLYAYWSKYAQFVFLTDGDLMSAAQIFNNSLSPGVLCHSIEMWSEYLKFMTDHGRSDSTISIIQLYVSALDSIGDHFRSDKIWKSAVSIQGIDDNHLFLFLSKAICNPINDIASFWQSLQQTIPKVTISYLTAFDPLLPLSDLIKMNPSEVKSDKTEMELRSEATQKLSKLYEFSSSKLKSIQYFESRISRPYFHFFSPDEAQISNWESYAAFMEGILKSIKTREAFNEVIRVFERAIIPCNFIKCIWVDYISFLGRWPEFASDEDIRTIFKRIDTNVIPSSKLQFAEFEESRNLEASLLLYNDMAKSNIAELVVNSAMYFEHRGGDESKAYSILREGFDRFVSTGDNDGASIIASELWNSRQFLCSGEVLPPISTSLFVAEKAHKASKDPQMLNEVTEMLHNGCFSDSAMLYEDRVELLTIYLQHLRMVGAEAGSQLEIEMIYQTMRHRLDWHKEFFEQGFLMRRDSPGYTPDMKPRKWIEYQRQNLQ